MATKQTKKRSKSSAAAARRAKKKQKRIILFIVEILVLAILVAVLYTVLKADNIQKIKVDEENIVTKVNENVENNESLKGYRNIALFGVDSREGDLGKGTRSDSIIIASINEETGEIKLCSVYRDTYLNLSNDSYNKCNSAYAKGGPEQAIIMLNMNLDLNITDYVTIGFDGLTDVIDALGGVYVDVSEAEIPHLNNYQISMVGTTSDGQTFTATEGKDYTAVTTAGYQKLNGLQATAYCRIRHVGNDFERAERQREVIKAMIEKAKQCDVETLVEVVNEVASSGVVYTSLDIKEMLALVPDLPKYKVVAEDGFPKADYRGTGKLGSDGDCVLALDLVKNVEWLHEFLFDDAHHEASEVVQTNSQYVREKIAKYFPDMKYPD